MSDTAVHLGLLPKGKTMLYHRLYHYIIIHNDKPRRKYN
jgi:hypothetical protein